MGRRSALENLPHHRSVKSALLFSYYVDVLLPTMCLCATPRVYIHHYFVRELSIYCRGINQEVLQLVRMNTKHNFEADIGEATNL